MALSSNGTDLHTQNSHSSLQSSKRRLIIRLSSLGDVILASSTLNALDGSDWVVAKEFADVLRGHPQIGKIWEFDRKSGLRGWLSLSKTLLSQNYDEVFDLHQTLRSRIARVYFRFSRNAAGEKAYRGTWRTCPKSRARSWGFFLLKRLWPRFLRPAKMVERYAAFLGCSAKSLRPDLRHLVSGKEWPAAISLPEGEYVCIMAGAQWAGKRWSASRYASLVSLLSVPVVVLGTSKDSECIRLTHLLKMQNANFIDAVGKLSLSEVAVVLSRSSGYIGNDTGLAHLAEAVGVPAHIVFGPTVPDQGFGPWRTESSVSGAKLWCRPCGKDGRSCFRLTNRYLCMTKLSPSQVVREIGFMSGRS